MSTDDVIARLEAKLRKQDRTLARIASVGGWLHVSPFEDAAAQPAAA